MSKWIELLNKIFGRNKNQSQEEIWKVVSDNYESEFYKENPNEVIHKIPLNLNSTQIKNAAINGVCPECGKLLRLSRIRKKRWFSNKAKTQITGIECPNKHDLDYNKRLDFNKPIYRDTEPHYDLSDYTNIIFENTNHKAIKILFDRFYGWLSD